MTVIPALDREQNVHVVDLTAPLPHNQLPVYDRPSETEADRVALCQRRGTVYPRRLAELFMDYKCDGSDGSEHRYCTTSYRVEEQEMYSHYFGAVYDPTIVF